MTVVLAPVHYRQELSQRLMPLMRTSQLADANERAAAISVLNSQKVFTTMSLNASTTLFARLFASLWIMTCFVALSTVVSRTDFRSLPKIVSISRWKTG
ncbi:hypothetical protein [Candidatus Erwinia dacicola]|uniref:Uncharacterized protein n=1 Tax=Candidatus Erwinia dacicola TaxID=252393 RepID=A0A328TQU2_9GAMM|nr:hypothetical protein [Candidatus Erwinia dacicola]NJC99106.1 hypothetical protein [Candidatus Erwinia dacicola]RAP70124.1 hypothetical protein ACZ87_03076 [Candidatus Erwinia dacicola]